MVVDIGTSAMTGAISDSAALLFADASDAVAIALREKEA